MSDNIEKEVEFYKALRLVTSNNYVRVLLVVLVLFFLDSICLRFFGADLVEGLLVGLDIVEGWNPDWLIDIKTIKK